jgi:ABC-2 type transport system ATP-binding protein
VRARIGYLPGEPGFYGDMTGEATLDLLGRLGATRVDPAWRRSLLNRLELPQTDLRRRMREYSTGMKRKLGLLQALQGDPPLLILDEPTEGLDPLMQESFYQLLADLKRRGRTVFMSSHVLSEVARICDRVALLRNGELTLLATVDEVQRLAPRRVRVFFGEDVTAHPSFPAGHEFVEVTPRFWSLRVDGPLGPLVSSLATLPVTDIEVQEPRLEDVLIKYYRESKA